MSQSLYLLTAEYQAAAERLNDLDLDAQTIADTLEGMAGAIELKAQNVAFVIRNMESMAEQIKAAEVAMAARRKAIENRAENVRKYLLDSMTATQISKIECPYFKMAIQQNPPALFIDDEESIPQSFWRDPDPVPPPIRYVDKAAVKAALKTGQIVPGAHIERGTRLVIK